jgi:hypothetical protein
MIYGLVELRPTNGKWEVTHSCDNKDRVKEDTSPNPMGFYYYPARMGRSAGATKLKNFLIEQHKAEIARLQKSLDELKRVKIRTIGVTCL